jgi:NTE family protein
MGNRLDLTKEYGLVLEGGGAKGAYQIGVWKAFLEYNVRIKGVAGVSVGALNGALICMDDYEKAEQIWENISCSHVMDVSDDQMDKLFQKNFKELDFKEFTRDSIKIIKTGGIDITPLENLIEEYIDEDKIRNSPIDFFLGTFSLTNLKEINIIASQVDKGYLKKYLLASSRLPIFQVKKFQGQSYLDGGVFNNVPIDVLIDRGYKNIIVIRIFGIGLEKNIKIPEDVNIIEIEPRVNLGNILEFDSVKSKKNIKTGYFDGLRCICGLEGKIYYIHSVRTETDYLNKLLGINETIQSILIERYKLTFMGGIIPIRIIIEEVYPSIAEELKLNNQWTYKELYISMVELCAKNLRIPKYKVYLEDELVGLIKRKYKVTNLDDNLYRNFVELIIKVIVL